MKVNQLFALAVIASCGAFTSFAQTWMQTGAPTNNSWLGITSSADGQQLIAAGNAIFISTNYGLTWDIPYGLMPTNGVGDFRDFLPAP